MELIGQIYHRETCKRFVHFDVHFDEHSSLLAESVTHRKLKYFTLNLRLGKWDRACGVVYRNYITSNILLPNKLNALGFKLY